MTTRATYLTKSYAVIAWLLAALAVAHIATTFRLVSASPFTKVWFFGSGVAMAQTAALNLLHRAYRRPALAWVTRASNVLMVVLATAGGLITRASVAELLFIIGALLTLLMLSFVVKPTSISE